MKFQKLAIAAALGAASTLAMAGGFDGPFVQLGIGGSNTYNKVGDMSIVNGGPSLNGTQSGSSFNGIVSAGYSKDMGAFNQSLKGFNLAANLFYVIGNQKSGSNSSTGPDTMDDGTVLSSTLTGNYKLENTWGISVEPGWNFTESTLGYVKLAWVNSYAKSNINYTNAGGGYAVVNGSKNINGFGYGLGVKHLLTKNIFVGVDMMGVTYGNSFKNTVGDTNGDSGGQSVASNKFSQFMGFASVGYKF